MRSRTSSPAVSACCSGTWSGFLLRAVADIAAREPPGRGLGGAQNEPVPDWVLKGVKAHWIRVECFISIVVGVMALVFLRWAQVPPLVPNSIPWSLGLGFGIGLMTSNDIATKLANRKW